MSFAPIIYNKCGWFSRIRWESGTITLTGARLPDRFGCFQQEVRVGPFKTAREAWELWRPDKLAAHQPKEQEQPDG